MTRKLNNDATMATVSAAFRDIWTTLENQDSLKIGTAHEELRIAVIRKLMDLVAEGTTDREDLKRKVLKTVPLR
jgi:hypothetical protein